MDAKRRATLIGAFLPLLGWAAWAQDSSESSFAFEDPVVVIGTIAGGKGVGEIVLRVPSAAEPPVSINDSFFPAEVSFKSFSDTKNPNGETLRRYIVVAENGLPPNTAQKRSASVTMGTKSKPLDYWLTNRPPTLAVSEVNHWVIHDRHPWDEGERCKRFMVYPGDVPGTNVKLLQANVERETTRESVDLDRLYIWPKPAKAIDLEAHRATPLQLCLGGGLWPGKYSGKLWLGTTQKPAGQSFDFTLSVRDQALRFLGLALIVAGVWGSWFLKARTKPLLNRLQSLAPAVYLQMQFAKIEMRLERLPRAYWNLLPGTQEVNEFFQDALSEERLDIRNFLPPAPPAPINAPRVDTEGYAQFIATATSRFDVLAVVVDGVEEVETLGSTASPAFHLLEAALGDLDKISITEPAPSRSVARVRVREVLATLRTAIAAERRETAAMIAAAPTVVSRVYPSYERIQVKIRQLNSGYWWAWAALTVLIGYAFLILNNPLFGNPLDLVTAFIWGFGIPTLLGTVASSSVATALGISVPQI